MNNAVTRIAKRLTGLVAKRPGLVVGIWGEPGIGKTHTVRELLRETPCRNLSLHATTNPTELARVLPRPTKLLVWAERILERVLKGEYVEIASLTDVIGATLNGLAPFVLHLEDIHEANPAQLEFVQALSKIVTRLKGVGLIITSREQPPEGFEAIRLEPLLSQSVQEMLKAEVSADLPTEALEWIQARAAGNPLFSLEFFRFLSRQGFVWSDGQRWRWRTPNLEVMPISVEALIEQTATKAMHTPTLEIVIQTKAFLGRSVQLELWAEVANVPLKILEYAKLELEHEGILLGDEFAHPLFAEVIARNLGVEKRQLFARRAIDALEPDPMAAAGFVEVANLKPKRALDLLQMAIQASRDAGNGIRAAWLQSRAVQYALGEEKANLALEAAQILRQIDFREATRLIEISMFSVPNRTQAIVLKAELLAVDGKLADAERTLELLPESIKTNSNKQIQRFKLRTLSKDYAAAIDLWETDVSLQISQEMTVLKAAAQMFVGLKKFEDAQIIVSKALATTDLSSSDRNIFENLEIAILLSTGCTEQAESLLIKLISGLSDNTEPRVKATALHNYAVVLERIGKLGDASTHMYQASELFAKAGDQRSFARSCVALGWQLWHLAQYEDAEALLLESRDILRRSDAFDTLVACEGTLCLMYLDWRTSLSVELAAKHAVTALDTARSLRNPFEIVASLSDLALVRIRQNRVVEALEFVEEMKGLCNVHGLDGMRANTLHCHALALEAKGQNEQALKLMVEAEIINQTTGGAIFSNKIGVEIARLAKDIDLASRHLVWFEAKGMLNNVNMILRLFPGLSTNTPRVSEIIQTKLEVFGTMQFVTVNSSIPVRGQKRRELLALLLEARIAGRRELPRLELLDVLYPNTDEMQAGTLLKDVVYQVREIGGSNSIVTTENGYALGEVISDAETFLETGNTQLWRGAYLDGLNLERNNETVRETLHLALRSCGENLLETDPAEAARVGRLLIAADSYDLQALGLTVKALRALQNHKTLSRLYTKAREGFLEIGEVLPERWQDFLETPIGIIA